MRGPAGARGLGSKSYRVTIYIAMPAGPHLTDDDYARLLGLRTGLRVFLRWSEEEAQRAGLTPAQHQLLLAIRGSQAPPTIGELAGLLVLRQHSTTELVDRAVAAGLVARLSDADDGRVVRVRLTRRGADRLEALSVRHLDELGRLARRIGPLIADLERSGALGA
jgi:DNA-binding MarR family transcriptional regulator